MGRHVEIGSFRERVEVVEEPVPGVRVGRIRHANGENASIDAPTLERLIGRAADGRDALRTRVPGRGRGGRDVPRAPRAVLIA